MNNEVWIVDDDQSILWVIEKALTKNGFIARIFEHPSQLLSALHEGPPNLVISDIRLPDLDGFELLEKISEIRPGLPIIIMTAYGDLDSAVDSFKYGAYEYLTKPFDINELVSIVTRALEIGDAVVETTSIETDTDNLMLGDSAVMQELFRMIGRIAQSQMGVMIRGESGAGKELVAIAIHKNSLRREKPLIAINTAAIPGDLLESELFGHEKGAFTGAHSRHIGRFEQAHEGTLFLDEIGDMPIGLQTRLLRVLSEGRFYRVGGREELSVDVRVIAATNQNLEDQVTQGLFRNDLFHRLNVLSLSVPPLRQRKSDIPILISYFLKQIASKSNRSVNQPESGVVAAFQQYDWPGNVRELQNTLWRLTVLSSGNQIMLSDLPTQFLSRNPISERTWQQALESEMSQRLRLGRTGLAKSLGYEFEHVLIDATLRYTKGHKQKAAEVLGWGRNTLTRKMKSKINKYCR